MSKENMKVFENIAFALMFFVKTDPYRILTRKDVIEEYNFTPKETTKIFNVLKDRKKLIDIGKTQKVTQQNLVELLNEGLTIKE